LSKVFPIVAGAGAGAVFVSIESDLAKEASGGDEAGALATPFEALVDNGLDGGAEEFVVTFGGPKKDVKEA
jgi:hypothetical protein